MAKSKGADHEYWSEQQAAEMTAAAQNAVEKWNSKRTSSARAFIEVCAAVAEFTDAKVKPTKEQDKAYWKALGSPSNFTKSAWRTIGGYAPVLLPHAQHLPTAQEAIKELARAEKKQSGAIDKLMSSGLNENSSVGDVRSAVRPYLGDPVITPTSDTHTAVVRSKKIEQVVAIIKNALTANDAINISFADDKVLADQVITSLGKWAYDTGNAARLVIDGEYPHNPMAGFVVSGKSDRLSKLTAEHQAKMKEAEFTATYNVIERERSNFNRQRAKWAARVRKKLSADMTLQVNPPLAENFIDYKNTPPSEWVKVAISSKLNITPNQVAAAVAKKQGKVKTPKVLATLQAEYDALYKASPRKMKNKSS